MAGRAQRRNPSEPRSLREHDPKPDLLGQLQEALTGDGHITVNALALAMLVGSMVGLCNGAGVSEMDIESLLEALVCGV